MFGFLKDKLKSVIDKFSKKVDEEGKEEIIEITKKEKPKTETKSTKSKEEEKPSKPEQKQKNFARTEMSKSAEKRGTAQSSERQNGFETESKSQEIKQEKPEHKKHKKSESKKEEVEEEIIEKQEELETKEHEQEPISEEEQAPQEPEEQVKQEIEILEKEEGEKQEKKGFFSRLFGKKKTDEFEELEQKEEEQNLKEEIKTSEKPLEEAIAEEKESTETPVLEKEQKAEKETELEIAEKESKGFFSFIKEKITTKKIDEKQFNELFWDLEMALLESNVAVEVIEKIKEDLKEKLVNQPIKKSEINNIIKDSLKTSIEDLFNIPTFSLLQRIKEKHEKTSKVFGAPESKTFSAKPCVICFIGVNGGGKTTTIAKIAHLLQKNKISCVMAAADTFRAAAIQQLEEHATNLNIKIIKHDYGADSAAVAFDAVKHAEARHIDAVLIDTAGRLHSNEDLMKEMQKLVRVAKPDLKIFIGESITGNDCVEQAKKFNELIGIDAIILSKADIDDKGGAAISVSYITKKPILYLGTGQTYDDLKEFNKEDVIKSLGL